MFKRKISLILAALSILLCGSPMGNESFAQGEVSFTEAQTLSVGRNPSSVVIGDFNGDSIPDLAVANINCTTFPRPSGTVSIFLGNGDGTFQDAQDFSVGVYPRSIAIGDFNNDKIQDLAVANESSDDVSILLGNGDGTFQDAQNFGVGRVPRWIAVGYFDDDDFQDLVVANGGGGASTDLGTVSILLGNGDGTFQQAQSIQFDTRLGTRPSSVAVGDFDGDTIQDLAVTTTNSPYFGPSITSVPPPGTVFIFLGNGDGTFRMDRTYRVENVPWVVIVEDFDGDTIQDLAVLTPEDTPDKVDYDRLARVVAGLEKVVSDLAGLIAGNASQ